MKSYAQGDYERLHSLIFASSKFSFFMLLCMVMPVAIEAETILHLWLGSVPEYTVPFLILTLSIMLLDPISNPLGVANNATGTIKKYQIVEGGTLLLIVPTAYVAVKLGGDPLSVFIVQLVISYFVQLLRLFLVCHKINMSIQEYCRKIIIRIVLVTAISLICPLLAYFILSKSLISCLIVVLIAIISVLVTAYYLGLESNERQLINSKLKTLANKFNK